MKKLMLNIILIMLLTGCMPLLGFKSMPGPVTGKSYTYLPLHKENKSCYVYYKDVVYDQRFEFVNECRKKYIDENPDLTDHLKKSMLQGITILGMNQEQLKLLWGLPDDINRSVNSGGSREQWVYAEDDIYFYFTNGILTSWQE